MRWRPAARAWTTCSACIPPERGFASLKRKETRVARARRAAAGLCDAGGEAVSHEAMPTHRGTDAMTVATVMTACPACCTPSSSLTEVARLMVDNDCGEIPVVEDMQSRKLAGVVTDRDIATRVVAAGRNSAESCAMDCMTSPAISVGPDTSLKECCELMETHQIRRVPVVDEQGGVVGIVSLADVVRNANSSTTVAVVKEVSSGVERS
jgi:CBS domain-containing protein